MPEEKEQPALPQQASVEFVVPDPEDTLFTTYANNVALAWTHFDVRMVFGEVVETMPEKIVVEQRAQITISYPQAKLLMMALAQVLGQYETTVGEVRLPADFAFTSTNTRADVPPGVSPTRPHR
jgi:hypothetical protein